jgi:hypothetical protein
LFCLFFSSSFIYLGPEDKVIYIKQELDASGGIWFTKQVVYVQVKKSAAGYSFLS